jgi:hypothetical protein
MVPDNKPQTSLTDLRAQALCRHQTALAKARTTFDETVAQINEDHRAFRAAYEAQWNLVKSDPTHPGLHIIRVEYEKSLVPPDHELARAALAEAVSKADADYQQELDRISALHGVVIRRFA